MAANFTQNSVINSSLEETLLTVIGF